jgi:hypothetical protein
MRLHDIQVIYASADNASKYQGILQSQQAVQAQNALLITAQQNEKQTQVQAPEEEGETQPVSESEHRFRQWKKRNFEEKRVESKRRLQEDKKKTGPAEDPQEHIIDIRI